MRLQGRGGLRVPPHIPNRQECLQVRGMESLREFPAQMCLQPACLVRLSRGCDSDGCRGVHRIAQGQTLFDARVSSREQYRCAPDLTSGGFPTKVRDKSRCRCLRTHDRSRVIAHSRTGHQFDVRSFRPASNEHDVRRLHVWMHNRDGIAASASDSDPRASLQFRHPLPH